MPRPLKAIRPVEKTINLPSDLCIKVDLILWSELEGKVPHGAWSRYMRALIEADLQARAQQQEAARKLMEDNSTPIGRS